MSKVKSFRCPVCETVGNWKNVDQYRIKPEGTHMCQTCSFVSYPEKYKTEEEIKEYYRKNYRSVPDAKSVKTGERKVQYHDFFLTPLFNGWKEQGIDRPVIGEVGSAIGMFLNFCKQKFPQADINGTELTSTYIKVAFFEYGIRLEEDFDFTKKYDLIASYHVLEHQLDPDIMLKKYADCLKDDGVFYLSAPVWFKAMHCDGVNSFDLEYYWHPDHINAWSEKHLEWIIHRAGLEVVYKNDEVYGNTYILKKGDSSMAKPQWSVADGVEFMRKAKDVWIHLQQHESKKAIELYRNCVSAWIHHYEINRNHFHNNRAELDTFIKSMVEACPNSADALMFAGDIMSRYEKNDEAIKYLQLALKKKPNSPETIMAIAQAYRQKAFKEKDLSLRAKYVKLSLDALDFIRNTSMEMHDKAMTWMFHDYTLLDVPKGGNNEKTNVSDAPVLN